MSKQDYELKKEEIMNSNASLFARKALIDKLDGKVYMKKSPLGRHINVLKGEE